MIYELIAISDNARGWKQITPEDYKEFTTDPDCRVEIDGKPVAVTNWRVVANDKKTLLFIKYSEK